MHNDHYLYYHKQEECLAHLLDDREYDRADVQIYKAVRIEEDVRIELNKYVAYIKQSIEALKNKEITVLFEPIASGYDITLQFKIARKNELVEVEVINERYWFGLKPEKRPITESIKINDFRFKQEVSEIKQEQVGEYIFIHIVPEKKLPEKKNYVLGIGDFDEEQIYPAWLSDEQPEKISFTIKGQEITLTRNPNGKYNVQRELLTDLEEVIKLEDNTLLRIVKPQSIPDATEIPPDWHYLNEHTCWIGPKKGTLPPIFESLTEEEEQEVIYDLLKEKLKPCPDLQVAQKDDSKWKVNGKMSDKSVLELPIRDTPFSIKLEEIKAKNDKDEFWLQLKESDKSNNDDFLERSPLEYFFDDDVEVIFLDGEGKKLQMESGESCKVHENYRKIEEKQIILINKKKENLFFRLKEPKALN